MSSAAAPGLPTGGKWLAAAEAAQHGHMALADSESESLSHRGRRARALTVTARARLAGCTLRSCGGSAAAAACRRGLSLPGR